jgi:hypothetical protein
MQTRRQADKEGFYRHPPIFTLCPLSTFLQQQRHHGKIRNTCGEEREVGDRWAEYRSFKKVKRGF